jgi:hypothetical protein
MSEANLRQSPAFSDFRQLMDIWDNHCMAEDDSSSKIKMLLDGQNLIMFFTKDNVVYGCPEESRLTFARIKHPNKDDADLAEARFGAINLYDALVGKATQVLFTKKDMKKIKIISQEKCASMLGKKLKKIGSKAKPAKIHDLDADQEDDRRPLRQED